MSGLQLYSKNELFSAMHNKNTELEISADVQKRIMYGNAQFIIDLMEHQKMSSFTITSLGIQLANYFFVGQSYLHYDRFIYCAAALMLAFKIREYDHYRIKPIIMSYYNCAPKKNSSTSIMNDSIYQQIKDKICIAESKILKAIAYELEIHLPFDFLHAVMSIFGLPREDHKERIFTATKIICFDAFRTYATLIFNSQTIAIAAFIIASSQLDALPWLHLQEKLKQKYRPEDHSEEEAYEIWLRELSNILHIAISAEDIKDCMYVMNELLYTNYEGGQLDQTPAYDPNEDVKPAEYATSPDHPLALS